MKSNIDKSLVEFVVEQIKEIGDISYKYMFGGCSIYYKNKVVALICGNSLYIRPTESGRSFIKDVDEESPYPGAKLHFLIKDKIDDKEWLSELVLITAKDLPEPKNKKKSI